MLRIANRAGVLSLFVYIGLLFNEPSRTCLVIYQRDGKCAI